MNAPARVGWCPGALRPMASGDGLILRVKPRGAALTLVRALAIADVSRRFGNGALDLTSHANLQIRGVDAGTLAAAIDVLEAVGLLDPHPAAEAVRNVVASPLAGLDPTAHLDIGPFVAALERRLTDDETLHRLPAKFTFAIDDGAGPGLGDVPADMRFVAVRQSGGPAFAVSLAGDDATGLCAPGALVDTAARLAGLMIEANRDDPEIRRMRHLVRRAGAKTLLVRAGLSLSPTRQGGAEAISLPPKILRVAVPFGRLTAGQFGSLTRAAAIAGADELRLTPWRAILIPTVAAEAAAEAARACEAAGLIVDSADPRLRVAACPGAPGCRRGTTPVLDDAARLARRLGGLAFGRAIALHVSGCGKGCAHAGQAPLTLVAHDGRYDVVIDGTAAETPVARGLTVEDAERWLDAWVVREEGA